MFIPALQVLSGPDSAHHAARSNANPVEDGGTELILAGARFVSLDTKIVGLLGRPGDIEVMIHAGSKFQRSCSRVRGVNNIDDALLVRLRRNEIAGAIHGE